MFILVVGVNYKTAPVEVREKLSFSENRLGEWLAKLNDYPAVNGGVIISTCNRTEIYATVTDYNKGLRALTDLMSLKSGVSESEIKEYLYVFSDMKRTIRHLFQVVSGIDSMVLGETQILGQVRRAYQFSYEQGLTNKLLNALFQKALTVGKRVRLETGIDKNPVSISYAAVELAKKIYGDLKGLMVLVIGAGKVSELTLKHLMTKGVSGVIVSNRCYERAVEMACSFGGKAVKFNEMPEYLKNADIVISCTAASHYVVKFNDVINVVNKTRGKKLVFIDIAVPRDIEPSVGDLEGVSLYDVDDLHNVVDQNLKEREDAAFLGKNIIEQEVDIFMNWMSVQMVVPTIASLKELGEKIKQKELTRALNRLGPLTEHEYKVISSMANSIVNQLLHNPVTGLKEYNLSKEGRLYSEVIQNLFNLNDIEGHPKTASEEN